MAIGSNYYQYGTPRSNPGHNNYRLYSFPNAKGRNGEAIPKAILRIHQNTRQGHNDVGATYLKNKSKYILRFLSLAVKAVGMEVKPTKIKTYLFPNICRQEDMAREYSSH